MLDQTRDNGLAGAIGIPGTPAIRLVLGLYSYRPTARSCARSRGSRPRAAQGRAEAAACCATSTRTSSASTSGTREPPGSRAVHRTDMFALNAIKAEFLGEGGGDEIPNALFLDTARDDLGNKAGTRVYQDLRMRNDPERRRRRSGPRRTRRTSR